jgi:aspartate-semialdehyde dehydrogenase
MGIKVGVLGVGPVGEHIVRVLGERRFPVDGDIAVMATKEREEHFDGKLIRVRKINAEMFKQLDLVFFAGKEGAKGASMGWADIAVNSGCVVIDNAGDFRMYPNIPLVIPEINMDVITKDTRHICNPNCSTIQMAVALYPLHKIARLRRIIVSTYQSVSGHSGAGMDQLHNEIKQVTSNEPVTVNPSVFARQIAFNCIPHIDSFEHNGYTREEMKMLNETRKIFGGPNLIISATTISVPVLVSHCESINAEFIEPMHADRAIDILSDSKLSPGVVCFGEADRYPIPSNLEKYGWKDAFWLEEYAII